MNQYLGGMMMCTSFVSRSGDILIAMNFDNNGLNYSIDTSNPNQFIVLVEGERGKFPSFGVTNNGIFFNSLAVASNGKGLYKRASKKVTHTTKLISDILCGSILPEQLHLYLEKIEVVNTPNLSCHIMICDSLANVTIIEPGRGTIFSPASESPFFVMTNVSLWEHLYENTPCDCERYKTITDYLLEDREVSLDKAFQMLEATKQTEGEWITEFSMVYSQKDRTIYYCLAGNFKERLYYTFPLVLI